MPQSSQGAEHTSQKARKTVLARRSLTKPAHNFRSAQIGIVDQKASSKLRLVNSEVNSAACDYYAQRTAKLEAMVLRFACEYDISIDELLAEAYRMEFNIDPPAGLLGDPLDSVAD